jgi:hypothetical protein
MLSDGVTVRVSGTLTTGLGALDSGRIGFVQDATGGLAIRLDAALPAALPAGSVVEVTGTIGSYFSLRTLNVVADDVAGVGTAELPNPVSTSTGAANDAVEGSRLTVSGTVVGTPAALSDGLGATIDDGSGELRVVIAPEALSGAALQSGDLVTVTGPLGQRDSSGTGLEGYRIHATLPGELVIVPPTPTPSPTPVPTPTPTPMPTASSIPTPSPTATATPFPTPTPSASPTTGMTIVEARAKPIGSAVTVRGVVTAESGRLGTPSLIAIEDGTAGIVVKVPDAVAAPKRGALVEVRGPLADPYGQIELRPAATGFTQLGTTALPTPRAVDATSLGESVEGRLVSVTGVVEGRPTKSTSLDITFFVRASGGSVRIVADASSRLTQDSVIVGATYRIVGIVGQRASKKGVLDGYRVWPRDAADLIKLGGPTASGTPGPSGGGTGNDGGPLVSIADAIRRGSGTVRIEGIVTTGPDLLDTSGRRIVVQDTSAGIEILLPTNGSAPRPGSRIRAAGSVGKAYDAPRLKASAVTVVSTGGHSSPIDLDRAPTAAHEWRLVRIRGVVADVKKLGDRWRAELSVGGDTVVVSGLAGAKIPVTTFASGRTATVVGIVRRPYPGATDRRWSIVPRSAADVTVTAGAGANGAAAGGANASRSTEPGATALEHAPDVDLIALADHVGETVRVGGLVTELVDGGFGLDDGTAVGRVVLSGGAAEYLPLLEPGDAVNATGIVRIGGNGAELVVDDPAGLVRVGDPTDETEASTPPVGEAADLSESGDPGTSPRLAGGFLGVSDPGSLGVVGALLAAAASVAVTALRRHRARRLTTARIAARLARVAGPPPPSVAADA